MQTKKSVCEICHMNITDTDSYRKIIANLLSGCHNIPAPFIILEGTFFGEKEEKNYLILSFAKKEEFKIGRSKKADISDSADLFISRLNSVIACRYSKSYVI